MHAWRRQPTAEHTNCSLEGGLLARIHLALGFAAALSARPVDPTLDPTQILHLATLAGASLLPDLGNSVATEALKRTWRRVTAKDAAETAMEQAVGDVVEQYAQQFADLKPVFAAWRETAAYDEIYARFQAGASEDE